MRGCTFDVYSLYTRCLLVGPVGYHDTMNTQEHFMKFILNTLKTLIIITGAMFLTAFTINATDNLGNFSGSALGGIVSGIMGEEPRCPAGMTLVDDADGGFCIDVYEASPSEECVYQNPGSSLETQQNIQQPECRAVSEEYTQPWTNVTQSQAVMLCAKVGKHLATPNEWYAAALGTPDSSQRCNIGGGDGAGLKETGRSDGCVSYVGAYDMIGNVWEWVYGTIDEGLYNGRKTPEEGYVQSVDLDGVVLTTDKKNANELYGGDYAWLNPTSVKGMFRGGYWGLDERGGLYSLYGALNTDFSGVGLGFRCVK
jgi:hypothetical protein